MKKKFLLLTIVFLSGCTVSSSPKPTPVNNDETAVVLAAKKLYDEKYGSFSIEQRKEILKDGPCLSNDIAAGWVVDIVHHPRQSVDDEPQNQCSAFREGKANHFVELDIEGNYIRAY